MPRSFQHLSEAVDWISTCLETGAAQEMAAHLAYVRRSRIKNFRPDRERFIQWEFPNLQKRHQEIDLRRYYQGREFPEQESTFTLGGHFAELGCIHIDFARTAQGWVLDEIWTCR